MLLKDLSHPLVHGQDNFPFDPKLSIISHGTLQTLRYNMTQISIGSHQGAHVDAMYHFLDEGRTIDQMPLDWFYSPAQALRIPKAAGEESLANLDQLPDEFTFIGFPMNLQGRDGSPIRAVAVTAGVSCSRTN